MLKIKLMKYSIKQFCSFILLTLIGIFYSPDELVGQTDKTATVRGIIYDGKEAGEVRISGNTWESDWVDMGAIGSGAKTVDITGCDQSNQCTTISQNVDNSHLFIEQEPDCCEPAIDDEADGLLPAAGLSTLLLAAVAALMYTRRPD